MADDKLREAALKPIATIKKPVINAEKKEETKTEVKAEAKKEEKKTTAKKAPAKKAAAKAPAKKAATTKKAEKPAAKKTETKTAAAKKETAAKKTTTTAKKATTAAKKAPAKKTASAEKTSVKASVFLQLPGRDVTYDSLAQSAKDRYQYDMNGNVSDIKTLDLYVKPEENKVYFVVNGDITGDFDL